MSQENEKKQANTAAAVENDSADLLGLALVAALSRQALAWEPNPECLGADDLDIEMAPPSDFPAEPTMCISAGDTKFLTMASDGTTEAKPAEEAFAELLGTFGRLMQQDKVRWDSVYQFHGELGRGGQGIVHLWKDETGFARAVKVFNPKPYGNAEAYRADMRRLAGVALVVHDMGADNVLDVEKFTERDGIYFMVMKPIQGFDLEKLMQSILVEKLRQAVAGNRWAKLREQVYTRSESGHTCLAPGMAVNIAEKCLRGLAALHKEGLIHGDIKPANIMLDINGSIKLVDIGSAFSPRALPPRHCLTPRYAPPEFHEGKSWTPQSDLASLGYVLIEMLSGQPVISIPDASSQSTQELTPAQHKALLDAKRALPGRLSELLPAGARESSHLVQLIRRLISPNPSRRFPTAKEAITDREGTYEFNKTLVAGKLAQYYASEIEAWLEDVMRIGSGVGPVPTGH